MSNTTGPGMLRLALELSFALNDPPGNATKQQKSNPSRIRNTPISAIVRHPQPNTRPLRKLNTRLRAIPLGDTQAVCHVGLASEAINDTIRRARLKLHTPDHTNRGGTIRPGDIDAPRRAAQRASNGKHLDGCKADGVDRFTGGDAVGECAAPDALGDAEFDEGVLLLGAVGFLRDFEAGEVGRDGLRGVDAREGWVDCGAGGGRWDCLHQGGEGEGEEERGELEEVHLGLDIDIDIDWGQDMDNWRLHTRSSHCWVI
ncbi:uncharacterized protein DSM5745_00044 [Aspergillus mulundensis]|uniref:Uncharacterized protein n=1 Tax=Aspergillus mulundensis TaxID=1810919 RepID=A0A3D8T2B9_9EURO|nr:hypothetical protein DSM5745_00044 [Aspergillus mulundensis]RDW92722.1 hypothetical protein DSM5745_00044 [Aspergillus mulundensis]